MTAKPHLFSKIFDFSYQRTPLQAFGFYIAQLMLYIILAGVILGFFIAAGGMGHDFDGQVSTAQAISPIIGMSHALLMAYLLIRAKGFRRDRKYVIVGACAVVLGAIGGPVISLMVVSYLSTKRAAPRLGKG